METQKFKIVEEKIMDRIEMFFSLFEDHWFEIAKNKQLMILKPDYEKYRKLEEMGTMKTLVAYEGDTIVGYSVNFIDTHLHYSELKTCYNDIIYVAKTKRSSPVGLRLIKATEDSAKKWNCRMMLFHVKEGTPIHKILNRKNYGVQDIVLSKEL